MGYYLEPSPDKIVWLKENGTRVETSDVPKLNVFTSDPDTIIVCLVNNGYFYAAGVAFSDRELDAFRKEDGRPKSWWRVPKAKVLAVCPEVEERLKRG